jgi:WD40 repeat protein/serine/threonine protein kinase
VSPEQWHRVAEIFAEAKTCPPADRQQWLQEACAGNEPILREVERLLRAEECAGDFLEQPLFSQSDATKTSPGGHNRPILQNFGAYHILGVLGEGGMAIVYLAEQRGPIQRRVALKIIKQLYDNTSFVARFESERQALALMNHPNIAQVFEAGTTDDGQLFLTMEYVPGIPLTDYADRNLLGFRERLLLFQEVCHAVQHAHQKGIIHRDLKPSNVLVTVQDGKPVPKVIDFGIAKALNQKLTERTIFTEIGMLVGTPEYMSPEQADADDLNVDTRTDVYSLGVLLYELLVGALPFDRQMLRKAGYAEILRVIREVDPPVPSMRLSTLGDSATEIARHRRTDIRTLAHLLKGDLEWITMKALDKVRGRRYASASEFAADIARHLANEPVSAGPPSLAYRGRKFVSRHRGSVMAATAVALAFCIGAVVSFSQYLSATREKSAAELASYTANLRAAELLLRGGQAGDARARLANTTPGLRGWEWRHLMSRTDQSIASIYSGIFFGSYYHVVSPQLRFSGDGAQIITYGGTFVRSWDTATKLLVNDQSGTERVLAVGPYGKTMLTGPQIDRDVDLPPEGFELHFYDAATRKLLARLRGMNQNPGAAAISDDGALVAAAADSLDKYYEPFPSPILVWDTRTGKLNARLEGHNDAVPILRFSPDRKLLLSGSSKFDRTVRLWDLPSGRSLYVLPHDGSIYALAFTRDGRRFVTGCDNRVRIWETATGRLIRTWDSGTGWVDAVAFSPDDSLLATSSAETVRLWDAGTGALRAGFSGGGAAALAFHPRKASLFGWDTRVVKEFDFERRYTLDEAREAVRAVAASSDGRYIAAASADHTVRIYDSSAGRLVRSLTGHTGEVAAVAFSPDSLALASGSSDRTVRLWSVADGRLIRTMTGHTDRVNTLSFYPDGRQIASGSLDETVRVWNVATAAQVASMSARANPYMPARANPCAIAVHPDGKTIAVLDEWEKAVSIWNAETYRQAGTLDTGSINFGAPCSGIAFSVDGELLAGPTNDATGIAIWDYRNRRLMKTLAVFPKSDLVRSVAFSPDKSLVAVGGYVTGALSIWDVDRGISLADLSGHTLRVESLAWAPGGSALISGSTDRTVRVWDSRSSHDYEAELLVERVSEGLLLADEIVEQLKGQPGVSADLLRRAIDFAVRRGDALSGLVQNAAWRTGRLDDRSPEEYRRAHRRATAAVKAEPWYPYSHVTLGLLECRLGNYTQAIALARRGMDMGKNCSPDAHGVCALAFCGLKDFVKAQTEVTAGREAAERLRPGEKMLLLEQAEAQILRRAGAPRR